MPQIISVDELKFVKKMLKEIGFNDAKVGVMIETPAAVQIIKELCDEGIKFASFGTNDLTQYMLAIDRGNPSVQHLYDEMHPAVLYQLSYVIRVCKRNNVESSICGQAGSKKEMVKFLVENGISSISVNADAAKEISEYVAEVEKSMVAGTDEEPRKYEAKKEREKEVKELPPPPVYDEETENQHEKNRKDILPEIRGAEKIKNNFPVSEEDEGTRLSVSELEERIEEDIEAIEEEKKEFLESDDGKKEEVLDIF